MVFKSINQIIERNPYFHVDNNQRYYTNGDIRENIINRVLNKEFDRKSLLSEIRRKRLNKERTLNRKCRSCNSSKNNNIEK